MLRSVRTPVRDRAGTRYGGACEPRLMELSAWATGVRLAYETLEGDVGGDA